MTAVSSRPTYYIHHTNTIYCGGVQGSVVGPQTRALCASICTRAMGDREARAHAVDCTSYRRGGILYFLPDRHLSSEMAKRYSTRRALHQRHQRLFRLPPLVGWTRVLSRSRAPYPRLTDGHRAPPVHLLHTDTHPSLSLSLRYPLSLG